jgi:penicillin-binding protein 2
MSFLGQEEQVRELQDRFRFVYPILFLGIGLLTLRLIYLQIISGDKMRRYAEENRIKRVDIPAPRGMIFDRNMTLLIDNRPAFDLEITPQYLKESGQSKEVIRRLSEIISMPVEEIEKRLEKARGQPSFLPIKLKTDLSRDEVAQIETWKIAMPGVTVEMEIKRTNAFGDIASHLLGYIGEVTASDLPALQKRRRPPIPWAIASENLASKKSSKRICGVLTAKTWLKSTLSDEEFAINAEERAS